VFLNKSFEFDLIMTPIEEKIVEFEFIFYSIQCKICYVFPNIPNIII